MEKIISALKFLSWKKIQPQKDTSGQKKTQRFGLKEQGMLK